MKDEIKIILDYFKMNCDLSDEEVRKLLDYITNLQEENEEIKNTIDFIDNKYKNTINYNEKLIEYNQDYKLRIDKAVEYIKTSINNPQPFYEYLYGDEDGKIQNMDKLLNILTGGDDNE